MDIVFAGARKGVRTGPRGDKTPVWWISIWAAAVCSCAQEGQSIPTATGEVSHFSVQVISMFTR